MLLTSLFLPHLHTVLSSLIFLSVFSSTSSSLISSSLLLRELLILPKAPPSHSDLLSFLLPVFLFKPPYFWVLLSPSSTVSPFSITPPPSPSPQDLPVTHPLLPASSERQSVFRRSVKRSAGAAERC